MVVQDASLWSEEPWTLKLALRLCMSEYRAHALAGSAGFRGKTLWDWLQLLIVPAILIGVTFAWSATQTRSDNKREDRRIAADRAAAEEARQDATLQAYLDQMSGLMLDKKLLTSTGQRGQGGRAYRHPHRASPLGRRAKGRGRTLLARGPAPGREARRRRSPIVELEGADLRGADLRGADLTGADLVGVDLTGAEPLGRRPRGSRPRERRPQGRRPRGRLPRATPTSGAPTSRAPTSGAPTSRAPTSGAPTSRAPTSAGADLTDADSFRRRPPSATCSQRALISAVTSPICLPNEQKEFLDSQEEFLDSLSREGIGEVQSVPRETGDVSPRSYARELTREVQTRLPGANSIE